MWRVGSPKQLSNDVHPLNEPNRIVGVPPSWYDPAWEFLVDDEGGFLIDPDDGSYLLE